MAAFHRDVDMRSINRSFGRLLTDTATALKVKRMVPIDVLHSLVKTFRNLEMLGLRGIHVTDMQTVLWISTMKRLRLLDLRYNQGCLWRF